MQRFQTSFDRSLTAADRKQNIPFSVQVPPGTTYLRIRLTYSPQVVEGFNNMLTLTVFDPAGWRGAGHRHGASHAIVIGPDQATPGFCPGPIQPGAWTVVLDTHMVMPGPECAVHLEVTGTDEPPDGPSPSWKPGHTASRGPGWYRGDLHAHTLHSDAEWDVAGLVGFARRHRLDFTTLSDHNTVSGLAELDAARDDGLLTIGGMELTTFWGHALALGLREWVDWRTGSGQTMEGIAQQVSDRGGLFIIAHPMETGDPYCTGCRWQYPGLMPGLARVVEVWNGEWVSESNNSDGLALVYGWLNQGCRLALTAGTDNHGHDADSMRYGFNVVYAEDLSEAAVLQAVRAGHLYLSSGPRLRIEATVGEQHALMGDALRTAAGQPVQVAAEWADCPPGTQIDWIVDGISRASLPAAQAASQTWETTTGQAGWGLLTARDPDGFMLALTNPIYFDGRD